MLESVRHEEGHEDTLVLLHSLALDHSVWERFVPLVEDRFDVVAVDLPGHGGSDRVDPMTIQGMAHAVADMIRREVGSAILVGLSLGGCVAQAIAIDHPDTVAGLALLDTTAWYGETAQADWEGRAQRAATHGLSSLAEFQLARWFSSGFAEAHPEVGHSLLDVFRANDIDAYVETCRAMGAMDLRDQLARISVPTMVVVGAEDPATPPDHADRIRQAVPGSSLHVIPDCSHLSAVQRPDVVARLLDTDLVTRVRTGNSA